MASDLNVNKVARTANDSQDILSTYFEKVRKGSATPEDAKAAQIALQTWGQYIKFMNADTGRANTTIVAIREFSRNEEEKQEAYRLAMPQVFPMKQIGEPKP